MKISNTSVIIVTGATRRLGTFGQRTNLISESREQFDIDEDTFTLSGMTIYYLYKWKR